MKKLLSMIGIVLLMGCGQTAEKENVTENTNEKEQYVLFTINTQEFIYTEQSIETVHHILDIHEQYEIPVDIYLTEDILRIYEQNAPELINRLKNSPVVAISYHFRPPHPYHSSSYDFLGLNDLSTEALYTTLLSYEEYATDPKTGKTTDTTGGYQHVKDVIGYAPIVVGMATERKIGDVLGEIYKEKGATFVVAHGAQYTLGDERYGLSIRPEDIEIILSEYDQQEADTFIPELWNKEQDGGFMNIKVHDNDFIATQSAWTAIYSKKKPPYNLKYGTEKRELLSNEASESMWALYENCVRYISEHSEEYKPINSFDLQELLKK